MEHDTVATVAQRLAVRLGAVRDREQALGHHERYPEAGLEVGFVEAGKGPAGVGRLELRRREHPFGAGLVHEGAAVVAEQASADLAPEPQPQVGAPGGKRTVCPDDDALLFGIEGEIGGHGLVALDKVDQLDLQVLGVEHDRLRRLHHFQGDRDLAGEAADVGVGLDGEVVRDGQDVPREACRIAHETGSVSTSRRAGLRSHSGRGGSVR